MRLGRRDVLQGMLGAGAVGLAGLKASPAFGQTNGAPVFPTIFIRPRGGWDPVQHFCAMTGITNRSITASQIATAKSGVQYFTPLLASMAAHIDDAVVIRNLRMSGTDHRVGANLLWYGEISGDKTRTPWTNFLASKLLARKAATAPNVTAYWTYDNGGVNDFINYNNRSPNSLAAAQRILNIDGFTRSLNLGTPNPAAPTAAQQTRVNKFLEEMDARAYDAAVQSRLLKTYGDAAQQANAIVGTTVTKFWPPDAATLAAFNLNANDLAARGYGGIPATRAMIMLAYQLARTGASHVISFDGETALAAPTYDTHTNNIQGQLTVGQRYFTPIAALLSALKATPSPIVPGKTMFDTTHVVVASEMGRTATAEKVNGTNHWPWTQALLFGGNFKRGYGFGQMNRSLVGVPADFRTGQLETGSVTSWLNVVATILKASGVDPKEYTTAEPIDAVLQA